MTDPTIAQSVLFPDLFGKPLVATFDREQASSNSGAVLLKAAERVYGLIKAFGRCLIGRRAPEKVRRTLEDVVGQPVFGSACGYPDGNDSERLADDPIHKLLLGGAPVAGGRLASEPTVSGFENGAGRVALYRLGRELATSVNERHRRRLRGRVRRITIDLDPTDDPTHDEQQLTFFNGHYDSWCYLPLLAFVSFDREVEQYLRAAVLRPGKSQAPDRTLGVCVGCSRRCGPRFPRHAFSSGSTAASRARRSSTSSMPSRGLTPSLRWPRTPCCCGLPSPSWWRPAPRTGCARRRRTCTSTPAIAQARGLVSAAW